jgi:hypothetical protein
MERGGGEEEVGESGERGYHLMYSVQCMYRV